MDPKSLSHLDPKLRETYERVMGVAAPSTPQPSTPAETPVKADASPSEAHDESSSGGPSIFTSTPSNTATPPPAAPDTSQPVSPTPYHVAENVAAPAPDNAQPAMQPLPSPAAVAQMKSTANAGPLLRILYILGAVVFFTIYTIFWVKVFNLPFFF